MISIDLLQHSALLKTPTETDEDRNTIYDEGTELTAVRIVPKLSTSKGSLGNTPVYDAVLYYDCQFSQPKNIIFSAGQLVEHNDINYIVADVTCSYATGTQPEFVKVGLNECEV